MINLLMLLIAPGVILSGLGGGGVQRHRRPGGKEGLSDRPALHLLLFTEREVILKHEISPGQI